MKIRFGEHGRFSLDIDVARAQATEEFEAKLSENLSLGWGNFTGTVMRNKKAAKPEGIPMEYIMIPYKVKLSFNSVHWRTIDLEVGHDELGDTEDFELKMDPAISELFNRLGLPTPGEVPLLAVKHQIAQKIHGASNEVHKRPHDLVDLQIIMTNEKVDLVEVKEVCERLFPFRKRQTWPPVVEMSGEEMKNLYLEAATDMGVLSDLRQAVDWANELITKIVNS